MVLIILLSETKTLYEFFLAKIAAPIPLSPAPMIEIDLFNYLNFNVTTVNIASITATIQNLVTILLS